MVRGEPRDGSNERLEFLGDAVLGLVVTAYVYRTYPDLPEGQLAQVRAAVVNVGALAETAAELRLGESLRLGKGEDSSGGREKPSILADAMEAVIGAVYLDGGWEDAAKLVMDLLGERITESAAGPGGHDYKTRPQELGAREYEELPRTKERPPGPDHAKHFTATVPWRGGSWGGAGPVEEAGGAGAPDRLEGAGRGRTSPPRPAGGGGPTQTRPWRGVGANPWATAPMPELPEVETLKRRSREGGGGPTHQGGRRDGERSIRRHPNKSTSWASSRAKKSPVERRGKYLLLNLDAGDVLVVHLGMSGQLLNPKGGVKDPPPKHTHVVITFTQGGQLRFVDPRTFGEMFVTTPDELAEQVPELAHLGFDPVDDMMSWTRFGELLLARKSKLKTLLMDQKFVAGLGNIYTDEILFAAGLRYDR